jgi:hypothetical protein
VKDTHSSIIFDHELVQNIYYDMMSPTTIDLIKKDDEFYVLKKINRKLIFSPE